MKKEKFQKTGHQYHKNKKSYDLCHSKAEN